MCSLYFKETFIDQQINQLADIVGPLLQQLAPETFFNMTAFNRPDNLCRLGTGPIETRPFSGTSCVVDKYFCVSSRYQESFSFLFSEIQSVGRVL